MDQKQTSNLAPTPLLICITLGFALCVLLSSAFGAEITVPDQAASIQSAIDMATAGDVVLVKPGTYAENLDFHGKNIAVRGVEGAAKTILNARLQTGVSIGPLGEISGMTISNAAAYFGGGMATFGVGTLVRSNIFIKNIHYAGGFGAAIAGNASSPIIEQNVFTLNVGDNQYPAGAVSFVNGSSPKIANNLFVSNYCRAINLTLPEGNSPVIENNTIVGNDVGILHSYYSRTVYRNNIIYGNGTGIEEQSGGDYENNLVFGNGKDFVGILAPPGTIAADPKFYDPARLDFRLTRNSPAVDAGVLGSVVDLNGRTRPQDGNRDGVAATDIGAFEYVPSVPEAPTNLAIHSRESALQLSWEPRPDTTSFLVKRAAAPGGPYTVTFNTVNTTFVDDSVELSKEYYYVVVGVNDIGEGPASAEVHERAGNRAPIGQADAVLVLEDTPTLINVLENDSDPDGDALQLTSVSGSGAEIVENAIRFTPATNFTGSVELEYVATDGRGAFTTNRVDVTVAPVNDAPVAQNLTSFVEIGSTTTIQLFATDVDSSGLTFDIVGEPSVGSVLSISATGALQYAAGRSSAETATIMYRAFDGQSYSEPAQLRIIRVQPRDLDQDGLPDAWENQFDLNNPNGDRDGDGMINAAEYLANTDPTDAGSVLTFQSIELTSPSEVLLKWKAVGQSRYRLQLAGAPQGPFADVARDAVDEIIDLPEGTPTIAELRVAISPQAGMQVFRIKVVP